MKPLDANLPDRVHRTVLLAVGGLGAAATVSQLTLIRELVSEFGGNELVYGIGLGCWLLLTAAGAWLGVAFRRLTASGSALTIAVMAAGFAPLAQLLALRFWRDEVLGRGTSVGIAATVLGTAMTLAPFCLCAGVLLTTASRIVRNVGRVYLADVVGSVAGGLVFFLTLVRWVDHVVSLSLAGALLLALSASMAWVIDRRLLAFTIGTLSLGLIALPWAWNLDALSTAWQYDGAVVFSRNSPYGRVVVTRQANQLTFFENGVPVAYTDNVADREESVHYAMAQRTGTRNVLLISGAVAGDAAEIVRYDPERVTAVELDPALIDAGRRHAPENLADPRLQLVSADARRFVEHSAGQFDVVIVDLPDPVNLQLNRFYTEEFFRAVHRRLAPAGVLAFAVGRYDNYGSADLAQIVSSAYRTASRLFSHVEIVPGGRIFFLASDDPLTLDIATRLAARAMTPRLVNSHYLAAILSPDRRADIDRMTAVDAKVNRDFSPVLCQYLLRRWLRQFATPTVVLVAITGGLLAATFVRQRPVSRILFSSGIAASGLEIVLLLAVQVFYGSLYQQVGLVVTAFMVGMAIGAWASRRLAAKIAAGDALSWLALGVGGLAGCLPALLPSVGRLPSSSGLAVLLLITLLLAALVGAQFPAAATLFTDEPDLAAARLFSADLVGAAFGALLASTWLIPVAGLTVACLSIAALNVIAAALNWRPVPSL